MVVYNSLIFLTVAKITNRMKTQRPKQTHSLFVCNTCSKANHKQISAVEDNRFQQ